MKKLFLSLALLMFAVVPFVSSAHYVVGMVNGTDINDLSVYLYTPSGGISENISNIIGVNGDAHVENFYMIDVEMLYSCNVGDEVRVTIDGVNFVSVIITGAGYDVAPTINYSASEITLPDDTNNFELRLNYLEEEQLNQAQEISGFNLWKNSIISTITDILLKITDHEKRISVLESKPISTNPNYFQYMSYGDRSFIICRYAKDHKLKSFTDLNVNCAITSKGNCACRSV